VVTYPIGSANYARAFVDPDNPESAHQILIRAYLTQAAQGFSALSSANADAWRAAAVGIIRKNTAGQDYELSGANLYSLINLYRLMDGQALTATPPALTAPGSITSITSVTKTGTDLVIVAAHTLAATDFTFVRVTAPLSGSARLARPNDYRTFTATFAASIVPYAATPQTYTLPEDVLSIIATDYVGVELLPLGPTYYPGVARRDPSMLVA